MCIGRSGPVSRGFTLIEILVVLVIIGLIAGVALPKLFSISQRFELASQRDSLLTEIGNLGYVAYTAGKPLVLGEALANEPEPIHIPSGWRVEAPQPIRYNFNGVCSGGALTLVSPDGTREVIKLVGPSCRTNPNGAAS